MVVNTLHKPSESLLFISDALKVCATEKPKIIIAKIDTWVFIRPKSMGVPFIKEIVCGYINKIRIVIRNFLFIKKLLFSIKNILKKKIVSKNITNICPETIDKGALK